MIFTNIIIEGIAKKANSTVRNQYLAIAQAIEKIENAIEAIPAPIIIRIVRDSLECIIQ